MIVYSVGDESKFSIEYGVSKFYKNLSQRALGYFNISINGVRFGVHSPNATLLACSLDAIERRLMRKGGHCIDAFATSEALKMAEAVLGILYDEKDPHAKFFNMSFDEFRDILIGSEALWAPDGDAAFDDGGHVLQVDVGDKVRLVAFINTASRIDVASSLVDFWMDGKIFYDYLDKIKNQFLNDWSRALEAE